MQQGRIAITLQGQTYPIVLDCAPLDMDSLTLFAASLSQQANVVEITWAEINQPPLLFVHDPDGCAWQIIADR